MNENKFEIFNSAEFGSIRTLETTDGKILFCGKDVANALGYSNASKALSDHCKGKGVTKCDTLTNGGVQKLTYIDEGNVYRLITHSKLPNAERFESWVFDEVLPTIRKTGGYVSDDELFVNTYRNGGFLTNILLNEKNILKGVDFCVTICYYNYGNTKRR